MKVSGTTSLPGTCIGSYEDPSFIGAAIAWYCMLVSIVVPIVACLMWCWLQRYQSHRRARMALEREQEMDDMSRMEANIQAFFIAEKSKRTKLIRAALKDQIKKITKADLEKAVESSRPEQPMDDSSDSERGFSCSICLENFHVGELVAKSSNAGCRHVFHEDCIVSWLVAQQHAFCPYCRRPFSSCLLTKTPQTSAASHDRLSTAFEDVESSRWDSSVIAEQDDQTIADALAAVSEDKEEIPAVDEETESVVDKEER